jgi:hypothetical protein
MERVSSRIEIIIIIGTLMKWRAGLSPDSKNMPIVCE